RDRGHGPDARTRGEGHAARCITGEWCAKDSARLAPLRCVSTAASELWRVKNCVRLCVTPAAVGGCPIELGLAGVRHRAVRGRRTSPAGQGHYRTRGSSLRSWWRWIRGDADLLPSIHAYEEKMLDYGFKAVRLSLRNARQATSGDRLGRAAF